MKVRPNKRESLWVIRQWRELGFYFMPSFVLSFFLFLQNWGHIYSLVVCGMEVWLHLIWCILLIPETICVWLVACLLFLDSAWFYFIFIASHPIPRPLRRGKYVISRNIHLHSLSPLWYLRVGAVSKTRVVWIMFGSENQETLATEWRGTHFWVNIF